MIPAGGDELCRIDVRTPFPHSRRHLWGKLAVADRDNQRVFYHTEVEERFGGRGLATILVAEALEATRADGKRVVPVCPMVAAFIKKHPEFNDITDKATPELLRWVETI